MALLLHLRTRHKANALANPSLIHLFSTSTSNDDEPDSSTSDDRPSTNSNSQVSSYFSDVKKVLKQRQFPSPSSTLRTPSSPSFTASSSAPQAPAKVASLDEIRKNLSAFRRRYDDPNSTTSSSHSSNPISFTEIYKKNVIEKQGVSTPTADLGPGKLSGKLSYDAIRESVRNMKKTSGSDRKAADPTSLLTFTESFKLKPSDSPDSRTSSTVIGGTGALPESIFGKEKREKEGENSEEMEMEFVRKYRHEELGDRLRKLRPEAKGGDWFSLSELSERLRKLREIEKEEAKESAVMVSPMKEMMGALFSNKMSEVKKTNKSLLQRLDFLGQLGRTPSFMLGPPKEHLVEKYFHPDNMSSAEKMKIELAKIRDEFKMSESDCGSFRVQVAQLTVKIKHLSSVLHKMDKHSRKGLLAMVQKRKRLLKYLRRTDWDSYCFVISKLGLRDNPDVKY